MTSLGKWIIFRRTRWWLQVRNSPMVLFIGVWVLQICYWIFKFARGINSGDKMTLCMDGTFGTCSSETCFLRFPVMERFCASAKWVAGKLDVSFLMSDDGAGFKSWALRDMPNAIRLKCFQHIGRKLFGSILLMFGSIYLFGSSWSKLCIVWINLIQTLDGFELCFMLCWRSFLQGLHSTRVRTRRNGWTGRERLCSIL